MGQLISQTTQVARTAHRCDECRHMIPPRTKYERQFVADGGDVWTWKMHTDCAEAAEHQFRIDGGDYQDDRGTLAEYENDTGEFPDWLRGRWPHVVCRLEYWQQKRHL